jgi:hypothetical protein
MDAHFASILSFTTAMFFATMAPTSTSGSGSGSEDIARDAEAAGTCRAARAALLRHAPAPHTATPHTAAAVNVPPRKMFASAGADMYVPRAVSLRATAAQLSHSSLVHYVPIRI